MKKVLAFFAIVSITPLFAFATPVSVDRLNNNHIEPLVKSDFIRSTFFTATNTAGTSTFPVASSTKFCLSMDCRTVWPTSATFGQAWELFTGWLSPTTSVPIIVNNATSTITNLSMVNSTSTNASSTNIFISGQLRNSALSSALVVTNAAGVLANYAGATCGVNTFTTAISALGGVTCAAVTDAGFSGVLTVAHGGTNASSFSQGWIFSDGGASLAASTSPTVNYVVATSTTFASQFWGGLLSLASSTFQNFTGLQSTTTQSTSTLAFFTASNRNTNSTTTGLLTTNNFLGTNSTTTAFSSSASQLGNASATTMFATTLQATQATSSTSFFSTSLQMTNGTSTGGFSAATICLINDVCRTTWPTFTAPFAYPFPNNATTTHIDFLTNGIFATLASTTFSTTTQLNFTTLSSTLLRVDNGGNVRAAIAGTHYAGTSTPQTWEHQIFNSFKATVGTTTDATSTNFSLTSAGQGWLYTVGDGPVRASTSPTVNYIVATSSTAASQFWGGLLSLASSTFQNFTGLNSTTSNATTTGWLNSLNLNVTNATTSRLSSAVSQLGNATSTSLFATTLQATQATTSNFFSGTLMGTNGTTTGWSAATICFTGDVCRTSWPTGVTLPVSIANGGTNATTFTQRLPLVFDGTSIVATTTNPITVDAIRATSTTVVSTVDYRLGIATTTPFCSLCIGAAAGVNPFAIGSTTGTLVMVDSNGNFGIRDTSPDYTVESVGSNIFGYFGLTKTTDGDIFNVSSNGNVGIGTTTPWAKISIASSTPFYGFNNMANLLSIATSSDTAGYLFGVNATTTTHDFNFSGTTESGARVLIGSEGQYGTTTALDQLVVNGRINTTGWDYVSCALASNIADLAADTGNLCGGFSFQLDGSGGLLAEAMNQGGNAMMLESNAGLNNGAGFFQVGAGTAGMVPATSTPIMEVTARIRNPNQATTTSFYIGFTNVNPGGTGFEVEPTAGCWFVASSTKANWIALCRTAAGSNLTMVDTGFASSSIQVAAQDQFRAFRIEMDKTKADFYIRVQDNGAWNHVARITGTYPATANAGPGIYVGKTGGTTIDFDFFGFKLWWRPSLFRL